MEINKNLSEFVWEYAKKHDYCSRNILSANYIEKFLKIEGGRDERKSVQKQISRQISQMFVIMKHLGICSRYSLKAVAIDREIFNTITLPEVLKYKLSDFHKDRKPKVSILSETVLNSYKNR